MVRHAMAVYDRATRAVTAGERLDMFRLYIKKAESFYGVTRTREIHEAAIKALPDKDAQAMALDYAALERKLGEVDRARAIFTHGAQLEHPKRAPDFWKAWHEFEVGCGNEDTFRDMLRVKRSVLTAFANETFYDMRDSEAPVVSDAEALAKQAPLSTMAAAQHGVKAGSGVAPNPRALDPMAAAELTADASSNGGGGGGVKRKAGGSSAVELEALQRQAAMISAATAQGAMAAAASAAPSVNPEEIDLDDEEEEDGEPAAVAVGPGGKVKVTQRAVPAAVFGDLAGLRA